MERCDAPNGADGLVSSSEAAVILDRSRWTVARLVREGKLRPAHQVPGVTGAYVFRRADVEALAATAAEAADGGDAA